MNTATAPEAPARAAGNAQRLPAVFVSHGSPMLALDPGTTGPFFRALGRAIDARFGRPRAIVAISPHTSAQLPVWLGGARHEAIHDFGGFPQALYELRYDAPGAPELARQGQALLARQGLQTVVEDAGGLDHGIWAVLRAAWPDADIPVLPLALVRQATPQAQWALGQALAPLRGEGVLLMGTGSLTHNLGLLNRGAGWLDDPGLPTHPACAAFQAWVHEHAAGRDWDALIDYRRQAPHAALMHPTDEHWMPFYVAAGAGGTQWPGQRLHQAVTYGSLAMDAYAFGDTADVLVQALATD